VSKPTKVLKSSVSKPNKAVLDDIKYDVRNAGMSCRIPRSLTKKRNQLAHAAEPMRFRHARAMQPAGRSAGRRAAVAFFGGLYPGSMTVSA
jgi:hypothetical protein